MVALPPATKSALQGPQSAAPATTSELQGPEKRCACHKNLHTNHIHIAQPCQGVSQQEHFQRQHRGQRAAFTEDFPRLLKTSHMSKSRFTVPATNSGRACHEKPALDHTKTRSPLRLPFKSDRQVQKCARHHDESAVEKSTRASPPISASLPSRKALRRSRSE